MALNIVFLTGLSGAGKSTAAHALEDLRYWCIDNLPVALFPRLLQLTVAAGGRLQRLAVVCDARDQELSEHFATAFTAARAAGHQVRLLFLEASDEALLLRYARTGRPHPLANDDPDLLAAMARERALLRPLRDLATDVIDTSALTVHALRREVIARTSDGSEERLQVGIAPYAASEGLPAEVDLACDGRFLRALAVSATQREGTASLLDDARAAEFACRFEALLGDLVPCYQREGKSYLTLGVSDGGSPALGKAVAQALADHLVNRGIDAAVRTGKA